MSKQKFFQLPDFWKAFFSGLIKPSGVSVTIALLMVVATLLTLCVFVNSTLFSQAQRSYWMRGSYDHYVELSANVQCLNRLDKTTPVIAIIGASSTHESFISPQEMETAFYKKTGKKVQVRDLTASAMWNWEMAAVADKLPEGIHGVVVLPVGLSRFSTEAKNDQAGLVTHPRLGFTSDAFDNEVQIAGHKVPWRSGIYFLDNLQFFCVRFPYLEQNILQGRPEYKRGFYSTFKKVDSLEWKTVIIPYVETRKNFYDENVRDGLATYSRVIDALNKKGAVTIVLLQDPMNPRYIHEILGDSLYQRYQSRMESFADSKGVTFLDLNNVVPLIDEDFSDHTHLRVYDTQRKYSQMFLDTISKLSHF